MYIFRATCQFEMCILLHGHGLVTEEERKITKEEWDRLRSR